LTQAWIFGIIMFLFDWKKIYEKADGNILICNRIMEMLITKEVPKNKYDSIYQYSKHVFIGRDFLIHPDVALLNAFRYTPKDLAIYYALSALRPLSDYMATQKITLDLAYSPVDLDQLEDNRLLRIEDDGIHFLYEEVTKEIIH
tara:strand:- start:2197 stop:2628 length:432 start_codon:yes stop_codon:yes gene_type:complete